MLKGKPVAKACPRVRDTLARSLLCRPFGGRNDMTVFNGLGLVSRAALLAALHSLLNGCGGALCAEGTEDCPCTADETCEAGLVCEDQVCKADESDSGARKPPNTSDGDDAPGSGGTGAASGAEGGRSEEPDDSVTGGTGANSPGEDGTGGAGDDDPPSDDDAGAAGTGNSGGASGSGGTDTGGNAGADASGGSTENGGSGGNAGNSDNGGSGNSDSGGGGGTSTGGTNAGGTGGSGAGSGGGGGAEPIAFPVACWGCAIEGCAQQMNDCRNDATCDACITTNYVAGLCAENAAYSELAECFCNNFCATRCIDVCE
jgi:hypothetical protein